MVTNYLCLVKNKTRATRKSPSKAVGVSFEALSEPVEGFEPSILRG